jgi:preprotein translocase subunit SecA
MADLSDKLATLSEKFDRISLGVGKALKSMFGSRNRREVQRLLPVVARIAELEPRIQALSDDDLARKTVEFKEKLAQGATLDDILIEAFACVREASRRAMKMRHFDVQMLGGAVLHQGKIAEMSTGEGKTLVATAPAYLNALAGKGVYVVTVNDYLAKRDRDWMNPVYKALGLKVGAIQSSMSPSQRHPEYAADITYGTNNEFGFDYLRDNMKSRAQDQVQKNLFYAIIDEVDSILVDEARTPLIISGMPETSTDKYYRADQIARQLTPEKHFEIKEKEHQCILTEDGIERAQQLAGVDSFYTGAHMEWPHHIETALRAHHLYKRDKEYVVKEDDDGQLGIIIVDEFTGRLMSGRRWSDGLHQAVEAKEGLRIREENQTLATITFQNYFRLYKKIAGMTGTAITEAPEFLKIYNLDVVQIPTNKPNIRKDWDDVVYLSHEEKYAAVVRDIVETYETGRPVLVGTTSIASSEIVSGLMSDPRGLTLWLSRRCDGAKAELDRLAKKRPSWLPEALETEIREVLSRPAFIDVAKAKSVSERVQSAAPKEMLAWHLDNVWRYGAVVAAVKKGVPHNVLNAKFHEREAHIVAQAGRPGAVTIATNMAGRGTDILLGGNPTEMAKDAVGRDAPPEVFQEALAKFQAQCEADKQKVLAAGGLAIIGTERHESRRIDNQLRGRAGRQGDPGSTRFFLGMQDDLMRIFARDWVTGMLKRLGMVEGQEIESGMVSRGIERAQKRVEQRNFEVRKNLLEYDEVMDKQRKTIYSLRQEILEGIGLKDRVLEMCGSLVERLQHTYMGESKATWELDDFVKRIQQIFGVELDRAKLDGIDRGEIKRIVMERVTAHYDEREAQIGAEQMRQIERFLLLNVIDSKWKDHLHAMTQLREQVGLRSYAQVDPKNEYKREGYENFQRLIELVEEEVTSLVFRIQVVREEAPPPPPPPRPPVMPPRPLNIPGLPPQTPPTVQKPPAEGQKPPAAPARPNPASGPSPARPPQEGQAIKPPAPSMNADVERMKRDQINRDKAGMNAGRAQKPQTIRKDGPAPGRNDPCPCGSGQKYKKCCFPKFGE